MSTLLSITFYKKIVLIQGFRHWKLDFKSFPTVYYMPNSDNRSKNNDRLKFAEIVSVKRRLDFLVMEAAAELALAFYSTFVLFFFIFILINFLEFI